MPIRVHCPLCDAKLKVRDDYAGKRLNCPKCKALIKVPGDAEDAPPKKKTPKERPGSPE